MNYLVLFSIHPIFLFEFTLLDDILLNMKEFVIQWRKLKGVVILKIRISEVLDFFWIFPEFILF